MSQARVVRRPRARTGPAPPTPAPEVQPPAPVPGAGLAAPGWSSGAAPALTLGGVQRKPVLGRPGDAYEQEADAVADRVAGGLDAPAAGVTRLGPGGPAGPPQSAPAVQAMEDDGLEEAPPSAAVQSMDAGGGDDEPPPDSVQLAVDRQFGSAGSPGAAEEKKETDCGCGGSCARCGGVQRAAADGAAPTPSMQHAAATAIASPGGGAPLPGATRGTLETRMGVDLGGVRVHDGPDARHSAARMHARAFTHGRHIWLGRGESAGDVRLMAHEVTHVLQQDGVVRRKPADEERKPEEETAPADGSAPSAADTIAPPAVESTAPVGPMSPAAESPALDGLAVPPAPAPAPPPAPEPIPVPPPAPEPVPVPAAPAPAAKPATPAAAAPAAPAKAVAPVAAAPAAAAPAAKPAAPAEAAKPASSAPAAGGPAAEAAGTAASAAVADAEIVSEPAPGVTEIPVPEAEAEPVAVEGEKPAEEAAAAAGAGGGAASAAKEGAPGAGGAPAGPGKAAPAEVELLMPEPRSELNPREKARLGAVDRKAGKAVDATTDLPEAGAMTGEARGAVEEPKEETDARAGDALVEALGERPAPSPEIEELCVQIRKVIRAKRPPDEDALVEAKPAEMAKDAGGQLNENVEGDAQRVQGQYDQLQTQPAGTPQQVGQPMGEAPGPAEVQKPGATAAVPEAVPPEEVSLDADVAASEQRMVDAGMETEPAKLVQDGPIADARAAQGELAETAARDPQEVLAEQQGILANASADMAGLQANALAALKGGRKETASGGRTQQDDMVGSEEQMRTSASKEAKAIFESAQTRVGTLLTPLPRTAMAKWDAGVKVLSTEFEQQLAKVKKWVDERHESTVLAVWDYFTGLPDWVTDEYDRAEEKFGDGVCELIREISAEVNSIIASAEAIIDQARTDIAGVFAKLPKELETWAAEQQAQFGARLDGLHEQAQQTRADFNRDLTQKAAQAVQDVRQKIHELREAAKGLIGRIADAIGEFLDDPIKFIINGLLKLVGIPPSAFWALVHKIGEAIEQIADDPLGFAGNLLDALGQGFTQFFDHIGTHLLNGLMEWLFSGLGSVGVQIPTDFSLKSIITFFLQLMGLSWANIRKIIAKHVGEENVALIEKAWELVSSLIEMGPEGLFELIKEQLDPGAILSMVLEAATEYLVEALIKAVTPRILLMFNPVGAILQAIEAIFRVLKWIFENAARIFSLVETIVDGVADLIAGNIAGMANAIEKGLAKLIPPVIDFLAGYLGLGDLPEAIADVIRGFQEQVLKIVDRIVGFLVTKAKGLLAALTGKEEKPGEQAGAGDGNWTGEKGEFDEEGKHHQVTFDGKSLRIASDKPVTLETLLAQREAKEPALTDEQRAKVKEAMGIRDELIALTRAHSQGQMAASPPPPDPTLKDRVHEKLQRVANLLAEADLLIGAGPVPPTHVAFTIDQGRAGTMTAEPLTIIQGNTTGQPAGDRSIIPGIKLITRWQQKTGEHAREKVTTPVLRSRISGTHVLAAALHGPWAAWNVVLTDQTLNNRMISGPETAAKEEFGTTRLRYEIRIEYYSDTPPPAEAYTATQEDPEKVRAWLGFYIGHFFHARVTRWTGTAYDEVLFEDAVEGPMPPVQGERIPSLRERIIQLARTRLTAKKLVQDAGTPAEVVWVGTEWSTNALFEELPVQGEAFRTELQAMYAARILLPGKGRGARLMINEKCVTGNCA